MVQVQGAGVDDNAIKQEAKTRNLVQLVLVHSAQLALVHSARFVQLELVHNAGEISLETRESSIHSTSIANYRLVLHE